MTPEDVARARVLAQRAAFVEASLHYMGITDAIVNRGMVHLTFDQYEELVMRLTSEETP